MLWDVEPNRGQYVNRQDFASDEPSVSHRYHLHLLEQDTDVMGIALDGLPS